MATNRVEDLSTNYVNGNYFYADGTHEASKSGTNIENTETNKNTELILETFNGISSGCEVRQRAAGANMSVDVQVGEVVILGEKIAITLQNVAIDAADGANPRIDLIMIDNTGTANYVKGTAAAAPVSPAWNTGEVIVGTLYVAAALGAITDADFTLTRELYTGSKLKRFEFLVDATNQPADAQNNEFSCLFAFPAATFKNYYDIGMQGNSGAGELAVDFTDQNRANLITLGVVNAGVEAGLIRAGYFEDPSDGSDDYVLYTYTIPNFGAGAIGTTASNNFDWSAQVHYVEVTFAVAAGTLNKFWLEGY